MKRRRRPYQRKTNSPRQTRTRCGLSLVEISISTLLIGIILVTSLKTVGAVIRQRSSTADDQLGQLLASQLMSEILKHDYEEPGALPVFGRESFESPGIRENYDDVDDYNNWFSAPETRDGVAIDGLSNWRRYVKVEFVALNNPSETSVTDQGVKRISVTVFQDGAGRYAHKLVSLKCDN